MRSISHIATLTVLAISISGCADSSEQKIEAVQNEKASTFARFVPERADDFAWENDQVAFRAYGPALRDKPENAGIDCWLKRVKYPIINKWYKNALENNKTYHKDYGEGLDNYHVGSSAGCGSTSLWLNNEREPLETFTDWEIISSEENKTVFSLNYEREISGHKYQEHKKITIELGKRLYKTESTFMKDGEIAKSLPVTVGLTTHDEKAAAQWNVGKGWLMAWEVLDGKGLGTAVLVDPNIIQDVKLVESNGVTDKGHALFILTTDENGKIQYQSGYGWEGAGEITSPLKWQAYLNEAASN